MQVSLMTHLGSWQTVAQIARTSTNAHPNPARDKKLVRYLYQNKHTSPFEFVVTRWYVEAPIFIARQWFRHRTWSYSEQSARYTDIRGAETFVPHVWRNQAEKNRQSSYGSIEKHKSEQATTLYAAANKKALDTYEEMLDLGVAREQARAVLPQNTYTRFYAQVDMHNLMHFLRLRAANDAQEEMQFYANKMKKQMREIDDLGFFVTLLEEE